MANLDLEHAAGAAGLPPYERGLMEQLVAIYNSHQASNRERRRFYNQKVTVSECNLGIAMPPNMVGLQIACCWPEKAVSALSDRSRFDGYVSESGEGIDALDAIYRANSLGQQYNASVTDELINGGVLCTLSRDEASGCAIRFHTFETSACRWNGVLQRIDAAFAIIDSRKYNEDKSYTPSRIHLYTDDATWILKRDPLTRRWSAERALNGLGRISAELLRYNPSNQKPCGTSRITPTVMTLTKAYIRTMALTTISLEFATSPQKYMLGVTDEQYDALTSNKMSRYMDSLMVATSDPATGQTPTFGQLSQGTIQPHVDMMRLIANQFAMATSLPVTDAGVVNDANPTSADAVTAANEKLIMKAQDLNADNARSMEVIGMMALAIAGNKSMADLTDEERSIQAHFVNPALPSVSQMADSAVKLGSIADGFAETDVFYEMNGFDKPTTKRIQSQMRRVRGQNALYEAMMEGGEDGVIEASS